MNRLVTSLLITLAIVGMGCSAGSNGRAAEQSIDPNALRISAKDVKFDASALSAPANERFQIVFDNQEGAPHNVAVYRDSTAREKLFGSDPFSGPAVVTYNVPALAAGTYFFRCDVHPDMSGQLTVG